MKRLNTFYLYEGVCVTMLSQHIVYFIFLNKYNETLFYEFKVSVSFRCSNSVNQFNNLSSLVTSPSVTYFIIGE